MTLDLPSTSREGVQRHRGAALGEDLRVRRRGTLSKGKVGCHQDASTSLPPICSFLGVGSWGEGHVWKADPNPPSSPTEADGGS